MVARARDIPREAAQLGGFNRGLSELEPFDGLVGSKISALPADMRPGTQPHVFTKGAFDKAYDLARSRMQFVADDPYHADVTAFSNKVSDGTLSGEEARQVLSRINSAVGSRIKMTGGALDGEAYKAAGSELGRTIDAWGRDPAKAGMAQALRDYQTIFDSAARRNSDPTAVSLLDAADRGYAKYAVIRAGNARTRNSRRPAPSTAASTRPGGKVLVSTPTATRSDKRSRAAFASRVTPATNRS